MAPRDDTPLNASPPDPGPVEAWPNRALLFDDVVQRYRRPLTAAARHLCADAEAAQDAVQDTLLAAFQGFRQVRDPVRIGAWLYAILRRKAAAARRAHAAEIEIPEDYPAPSGGEADALVGAVLREQLDRLPLDDREILAGHFLMGLSYREIGEALGLKEGAVRVRCYRAKERMRELLQGAGVRGEDAR